MNAFSGVLQRLSCSIESMSETGILHVFKKRPDVPESGGALRRLNNIH